MTIPNIATFDHGSDIAITFNKKKTSNELILKDLNCFFCAAQRCQLVLVKLGPMDVLEIVKLTNLAAQRCCLLGCPRKLVNG